MKLITHTIIICCGFLVSCYKPYTANVESNEKILVVDGLITNEVASYHISLSYALPFYSESTRQPVNSAQVYVSDDLGSYYPFKKLRNGYYISDSLQFTGHPGRTYTLYIETPDGKIYMSDPQRLNHEYYPDTIYAEVDYQKTISRFNEILVIIRGANILTDIRIHSDTLPRFRLTSNLVKQYFYALNIPPPPFDPPLYSFFCWETDNANPDLNLTDNDYSLNSSYINRNAVYFITDQTFFDAFEYGLGSQEPDLSYKAIASPNRKSYLIKHRVLYLNLYTLNNETYLYYKSMDEQLRSEGKLFDPIAVQLSGNINCTTNPDKKTFGFFEASSVSRTSYIIGFRNAMNDQYLITKIPCFLPPEPNGCWINKVPPFWVY
ncbi:MAG: DUF4249 domain-containing protein [Bacteroidales bacterium]|nr:DUF4249 domain-containing protein [Bacteroidales bacterium]